MSTATKGRWRLYAGAAAAIVAGGTIAMSAGSGASTTHSLAHAKSPYDLHAILAETGSASFLGDDEAKALQALQSAVNSSGGIDGHPLKVIVSDDQSNPTVAVSLAAPLIHSVKVLLIGSVTTTDEPVDALATSSGPVIYDLSPGDHPKRGSFVFSASDSTVSQARAEANFMHLKHLTRVAAITSTDASGQDGWTSIQDAASSAHLKVLDHETFDPTATSVTSQLATIKAKHPQALYIWTTGTPLGTVLKGMQQLGMGNIPTFTTPGNESYSELTGFASIVPNQLYFASPAFQIGPSHLTGALKAAVTTFDTAMHKVGVKVPDEGASLSYDPGKILVDALRKLGPNASATKIKNYLTHLSSYAGVDGYYDFASASVAPDQRGLGIHDVYMTEWSKAKKNWIGVSGPAGLSLIK